MRAYDLYNGPTFRVLHACVDVNDVSVWVLSAEHGLISGNRKIARYDRKMTAARAEELREQTAKQFDKINKEKFHEWMVCVGKNYAHAMMDCSLPPRTKKAEGSIGRRVSILKQWLEKQPVQSPRVINDASGKLHSIRIGGKTIRTSGRKAKQIAESAQGPAATNFQTWYVQTIHGKVAAKWLVSELTGLPVARFRTADALRMLEVLEIPVSRKQ